jgi:hypothetical protein
MDSHLSRATAARRRWGTRQHSNRAWQNLKDNYPTLRPKTGRRGRAPSLAASRFAGYCPAASDMLGFSMVRCVPMGPARMRFDRSFLPVSI